MDDNSTGRGIMKGSVISPDETQSERERSLTALCFETMLVWSWIDNLELTQVHFVVHQWLSELMHYDAVAFDSFFHSDEQPELKLENDYLNKTGHNLKTNSSILLLYKVSDSA